jgi:hypothetical protein
VPETETVLVPSRYGGPCSNWPEACTVFGFVLRVDTVRGRKWLKSAVAGFVAGAHLRHCTPKLKTAILVSYVDTFCISDQEKKDLTSFAFAKSLSALASTALSRSERLDFFKELLTRFWKCSKSN